MFNVKASQFDAERGRRKHTKKEKGKFNILSEKVTVNR